MQARVDSLTVDNDMVSASLSQGEPGAHRSRRRRGRGSISECPSTGSVRKWQAQLRRKQEPNQRGAAGDSIEDSGTHALRRPAVPRHSRRLLASVVPTKYQMSQICISGPRGRSACGEGRAAFPARRILNGEKFSTLARLYSEDTRRAR